EAQRPMDGVPFNKRKYHGPPAQERCCLAIGMVRGRDLPLSRLIVEDCQRKLLEIVDALPSVCDVPWIALTRLHSEEQQRQRDNWQEDHDLLAAGAEAVRVAQQ